MIGQVVLMVEHLHRKNILYRDLKPENILIGNNGYLKLIDFGLSKQTSSRTYTVCGTPEYLAPEVLLQKGHGKAVDWWCVGILIYELLLGVGPFTADEPMDIYENILYSKPRFPKSVSGAARSLMKHLLKKNQDQRYGNLRDGAKDVRNHRFFNRLKWDQLEG